uniref:Uncharacterized protein n=1 Tax=Rhizophora mucronata TaxID=61149 RepID=A0A2P2NHX9_RHIMU
MDKCSFGICCHLNEMNYPPSLSLLPHCVYIH